MPSSEALRNPNGPAFTLRKHDGDGLRAKGESYDMREFGDFTAGVGHIFFHPGTRAPPIPPFAELTSFMAAHPTNPIVVDHNRKDGNPCEDPHAVFAQLQVDGQGKPVTGPNNVPKIRLFTVAADTRGSRAFEPATHVKNGTQYEGVDIHNWGIVNFDAAYKGRSLSVTFGNIFSALMD